MSNPIILYPAQEITIPPQTTIPIPTQIIFKPARIGAIRIDEIADIANGMAQMATSEDQLRTIAAFAQALGVKLVKVK